MVVMWMLFSASITHHVNLIDNQFGKSFWKLLCIILAIWNLFKWFFVCMLDFHFQICIKTIWKCNLFRIKILFAIIWMYFHNPFKLLILTNRRSTFYENVIKEISKFNYIFILKLVNKDIKREISIQNGFNICQKMFAF